MWTPRGQGQQSGPPPAIPSTSAASFSFGNFGNPRTPSPAIQGILGHSNRPFFGSQEAREAAANDPFANSGIFGNPSPAVPGTSRQNRATGGLLESLGMDSTPPLGAAGGARPWDDSMFRTPLNQGPRSATPQPGTSASSVTSGMSASTGSSSSSSASSTSPGGTRRAPIEPLERTTIVAVVEGRGLARGEVGIACMNINTPNLIICQFNDTQNYMRVIAKINVFRPYEILMNASSCDATSPSQLHLQLMREIKDVKIIPIQRRVFNEAKGLQRIQSLVADKFLPVVHSITNKYYGLAASHAVLKYVELMQSIQFSQRTMRVEFQGCDQTCMIDHVTAQHLELLQNNQTAGSAHCLLGILNSCKTPTGARLLRMNILQPSCDLNLINTRLTCVAALMADREVMFGLEDILGRLPMDIEHVIASLIQIPKTDSTRMTETRINYVIALKHILELIPSLTSVLEKSENDYFQALRTSLVMPQFEAMLERVKHVIHDEAQFQKGSVNMKRQRCFAVKAEVNPILDIARKAYCELVDDINSHVIQISQEQGISFRLANNLQRGFFVQFFITNRNEEVPSFPAHFLQVKRRGNVVTFTTETLISLDHRAQEVLKEIENLSCIVIAELINAIRNEIGVLYNVSEAIGNLDLIYSLANYALTTPRCVRPEFLPETTAITMGRHPILDAISEDPSVPNNTFLSFGASFMVITGPNMSGKTTYIKEVALLHILAQLGSYVPADAAAFRIINHIMSRIGTGDSIEENSSSFALEMTEMTYILQNATEKSLIIIDELGRATSIEEGAAISWAISEELITKKSFVLFATHHMLLTKLESMYFSVNNFKMETEEYAREATDEDSSDLGSLDKLKYTHVIKKGVTDVEYYGLKLAMNTSYPREIIANAVKMSKEIVAQRGIEESLQTSPEIEERRLLYQLGMHLHQAADMLDLDNLSREDARHFLESLQQEFRTLIAAVRERHQTASPPAPADPPGDGAPGTANSSFELVDENVAENNGAGGGGDAISPSIEAESVDSPEDSRGLSLDPDAMPIPSLPNFAAFCDDAVNADQMDYNVDQFQLFNP